MSIRVHVFETPSVPPKRLTNSQVKERVKALKQESFERFGLDFKLSGNYRKGYIRFKGKDPAEHSEILFYFCNLHKGIYFQEINIPRPMRHQGIGTFYVNWLKQFCQDFGIKYIVLGSRSEAEAFWDKMGFSKIPYEEAIEKYPWIDPVATCFNR